MLRLLLTPLTSSPPWQSGVSLFPKAAFLGWKNFFIHVTYRQGSHHTRQGVDHLLLFVFNNPVLPCPSYGVSALKWAQLSFLGPLSISPSTPLKPHNLWPAGSRYNGLKITVTVRICVWWFNAWELGEKGWEKEKTTSPFCQLTVPSGSTQPVLNSKQNCYPSDTVHKSLKICTVCRIIHI